MRDVPEKNREVLYDEMREPVLVEGTRDLHDDDDDND